MSENILTASEIAKILKVSKALAEDPIIDAVAQSMAEIMCENPGRLPENLPVF
jgi:hypothetical protein